MDVFKSTSFVFLIVSIAGVAFVNAGFEDATTIHGCLETLKDDAEHGGMPCKLIPEYAKCAVRTTGLMKSLTTTKAIQQSQDAMKNALRSVGFDCSIDLFRIVDELRSEGYTGQSSRDPNKKLTYENAETAEECIEAGGQKTLHCSQLSDFLKCNVRTEGVLDFLDTPEAIRLYEEKMEQILRSLGVHCDFNMHQIVQELKAATKTEVKDVHTVSGQAAPSYRVGGQLYQAPFYKVHHSYYERNTGVSTTMKGLNLGYMAIITVLTIVIAYIR